jgi:hypothetical protein
MAQKGQTTSEETKAKMRTSALKRIRERPRTSPVGLYTPPKGSHPSPETEFKKGITPLNSMIFTSTGLKFKGTLAEYKSLHHRINKKLGQPRECRHCHTTTAKVYHWANISGEYLEDPSDWIRLCIKCHYEFDKDSRKKVRHLA